MQDVELQKLNVRDDNGETFDLSDGSNQSQINDEFVVNDATYLEIFKHFLVLGWTAFGGPAAHIAYFQKTFVEGERWISTNVFLGMLALGQCLPGPTSTQMSFGIGVLKKGIPGGLLSGFMFLHPGFLILSFLGAVFATTLQQPAPYIKAVSDGLSAMGVALVAIAAVNLSVKVAVDQATMVICAVSTFVSYYTGGLPPFILPLLILLGGLTTLILYWKKDEVEEEHYDQVSTVGCSLFGGILLLCFWAFILISSMILVSVVPYESSMPLHWFEVFYRTGSLIFGGGQVVLPLLLNYVVRCSENSDNSTNDSQICQDSWMTQDQFYAGLAAAQAMPGPLFNFSAYIGAVIATNVGISPIVGILVCWVGLFSPGVMIIFGILPLWDRVRRLKVYRKMLPGLNGSAVGMINSAVFIMTFKVVGNSNFPKTSVALGIIGFSLVNIMKTPAPLVVVFGGILGFFGWLIGTN